MRGRRGRLAAATRGLQAWAHPTLNWRAQAKRSWEAADRTETDGAACGSGSGADGSEMAQDEAGLAMRSQVERGGVRSRGRTTGVFWSSREVSCPRSRRGCRGDHERCGKLGGVEVDVDVDFDLQVEERARGGTVWWWVQCWWRGVQPGQAFARLNTGTRSAGAAVGVEAVAAVGQATAGFYW